MFNKSDQSDRVPGPNEKPENCYCVLYAMAGRQARVSKAAGMCAETSSV
jgi:hypothetical protein